MNVLGIETSCDETAASIVSNGRDIRSNIVVSSLKEHEKYGGIIPEIASRRQLECIKPVVTEALLKAKLSLNQINGIAVTNQPGLIGSLLVGLSFAKALGFATKKPIVLVDHIKAHLYANFLTNQPDFDPPKLPAVGLIVSGGHTSLYYIKNFHEFKLLGQTRDDAAGEAYDKVARLLGLGYPGGPIIDKLAQKHKKSQIQFTCAQLPDTLDFSFSGIKTAVLYYQRDHNKDKNFSIPEVVTSFQNSIVSVLTQKCLDACSKFNCKALLVGGGVAANSALRESLAIQAKKRNIQPYFPPIQLCLDNAAMIAGLGFHLLKEGQKIK